MYFPAVLIPQKTRTRSVFVIGGNGRSIVVQDTFVADKKITEIISYISKTSPFRKIQEIKIEPAEVGYNGETISRL